MKFKPREIKIIIFRYKNHHAWYTLWCRYQFEKKIRNKLMPKKWFFKMKTRYINLNHSHYIYYLKSKSSFLKDALTFHLFHNYITLHNFFIHFDFKIKENTLQLLLASNVEVKQNKSSKIQNISQSYIAGMTFIS